jgi:cytochrome oxidase Cu insertion factor (SCO1/SenC/PrrC family)
VYRKLHPVAKKLKPAAKNAGYRRNGELDHPARVFLIDPRGNTREIYALAFFDERQDIS